jgi:hypothetical protein
MNNYEFKTQGGRATVHVGAPTDFSGVDEPGVEGSVLGGLEGTVAWLDWIEAPRGRGSAFLSEILATLAQLGVDAVGAQVVPIGASEGSPAVDRLSAFYERHGFERVSHLAPWSDWPVVLKFLGGT